MQVQQLSLAGYLSHLSPSPSPLPLLLIRSLSVRGDPTTYLYLASMFHNTGRLKEARQAFQEGLNLAPQQADLLCGMVGVASGWGPGVRPGVLFIDTFSIFRFRHCYQTMTLMKH